MIFNEIDKTNIVKNKINLEKKVEYIYSSGENDSFNHKNREDLGIESPGVYGSEPVSGITCKNVKYVNSESLENVHIGKLHIEAKSIDTFDREDYSAPDDVLKKVTLSGNNYDYRISNDKNKNYSFGVKRIKKKYLSRDLNTEKIKSVKRIQEYYNKRYSKDNYKKMNWGFSNYNSLNMFTSGVFNDNAAVSIDTTYKKTHKNSLIYPNVFIAAEGKSQYDFNDIEEKTFSFYVNPNQKNIQNHNGTIFGFNAGCVLFVPGVIAINIIKGSSIDGKGFVDKFRVLVQLGSYSYDKIDYSDIGSQSILLTDTAPNNYVKATVSKDNILSFNNWHNVCVTLKKVTNEQYIIQIFVDGNLSDTFSGNVNFEQIDSNSYITIGNKPTFDVLGSSQEVVNQQFIIKHFSENRDAFGDLLGPYSQKHISFGREFISIVNDTYDTSFNSRISFNDALYGRTDEENDLRNTNGESFAFHGEIHDIRILNISCDEILAKDISEHSVKENNQSFDLSDLIFYVPFYYAPILVKKKGIVNLKKSDTNGQIEKQNIAYSFPTNPYYFNYTGGHETSVENFVVEFVKGSSPNINLEDSAESDMYSILHLLTGNDLKVYSQKGEDPLEGCIKQASIDDNFWLLTSNKDLIYRNNMIFPNDNGIQEQNIQFSLTYFFEDIYKTKVFEEFNDYYNSTFVFTKNYIENSNFINSFFSEDFQGNENLVVRDDLFDVFQNIFVGKRQNLFLHQIDNFFRNSSFRQNVLESYLVNDSFVKRKDVLWNSSNRNFHNYYYANTPVNNFENFSGYFSDEDYMTFVLQNFFASHIGGPRFGETLRDILLGHPLIHTQLLNDTEKEKLRNKIIFSANNLKIPVGKNEKFKTYSNPCSRLYESQIILNSNQPNKLLTRKTMISDDIDYYQYNMPLYVTDYDKLNYDTVLFSVSSQLVNKGIKKQTFEITDVDLYGSGGKLKCTLKDNSFGQVYRSNCLTKVATWNSIGNILYSEGFININHPGLYNFGHSNFKSSFESSTCIYVHELNIPAYSGQFNVSNNNSYIEGLRLDSSSFNLDEDFVYITDINIHDENLNVLAKARLARPFAKKNSDNVLFRLKMDY